MKANVDAILGLTSSRAAELLENLTKREQEVAGLIAEGLKPSIIAKRLGISTRTLDVHRRHLRKKLKTGSAVEIAKIWYAKRFGEHTA